MNILRRLVRLVGFKVNLPQEGQGSHVVHFEPQEAFEFGLRFGQLLFFEKNHSQNVVGLDTFKFHRLGGVSIGPFHVSRVEG